MSNDSSQNRMPPGVTPPSADIALGGSGPRQLPDSGPHEAMPASVAGLKLATVSPSSSLHDADADAHAPSRPPPERADPYLGCTIDGRYKIEALLGEGGMGVVYRCRHKIIDKKVAMKILRADLARDVEVTERFLIEAKAASSIGNQHIIDISDFGQLPDGSTYFVMEFLEGVPLSRIMEGSSSLGIDRISHIGKQIAEGLSAAHAQGIVHRDLKPDNVFLVVRGGDKDFVKILDFGIAKVSTSATGKLTRAGSVFGTPHYMSPEQAAGAPVDQRTDIYSLGVMLYEMASGKVPFDADNFMGILTQHMYKAPVPIRALVPQPQDVPPGLEAIVLKCLSKRPEQRYQSMTELVEDFQKLEDGLIPGAVPDMMARSGGFNVPADYFKKGDMPAPVPASPVGVPSNRWPLYAGIAGVCAAVGIVIAIFAKSASSDASPSAPTPEPTASVSPPPAPPTDPVDPSTISASKQVMVAVEPIDARVFRGDTDLGASPVMLEVKEGEKIDVEIRREGFKSRTITIDGTEEKLSAKLEKLPGARGNFRAPPPPAPAVEEKGPRKTAPAPAPRKPQIGGGEIVNPWGN